MARKLSQKRSGKRASGGSRRDVASPPAVAAEAPRRTAQRQSAPPADGGDLATTIVGVGASAGGLDAFSHLLERLEPNPGLAFVFVPHLAPAHESALTTLLAAKTDMQVVQAESGTKIRANHIYVIPPNAHMDIVDGELHLIPRPTDRTQFTPVDFFFESLARFAQDRAIGVILSGTASDGAIGVREIKALGGITIAQTPETAKYDGMPRAAIATGLVDLVLAPDEIAEHLSHVREHPYLVRRDSQHAADEPTVNDAQLREVLGLLRRTSTIDFKQYKTPTVKRRLLRRMALLRIADVNSYIEYLSEHTSEASALSQDLLVHVTRFFRDPDSFTALRELVFPELMKAPGDDPVRIWVPGCATGEEAYTVAISLIEFLGDRFTERRVQIFATDVSEAAIDKARSGTYPVSIAADLTPDRLKRFFTKSDGCYRVVKLLRDMCVFARHDLTRDPPFSRLDLVVCRNVLIYLDATLQNRLMSVFHYALKTRGFLMLGPAETVGVQTAFTTVDKRWRIFVKGRTNVVPPLAFASEPVIGARIPTLLNRQPAPPHGKSVQDEANRLVIERFGPPGVIVDSHGEIVQFRGHTGPYLEASSGEPNLNVLKMARGGLLHPLRTALGQARRRMRFVRKPDVLVQRNGDWVDITLEVVPMSTSAGHYFLVLFREGARAAAAKPRGARQARGRAGKLRESDARIADLRRELAANREYLQSIIQELEAANEELQSANEEILSSNEELQSTNEELDTAKEELQSTNEELNTVNDELHSRNEELTRANSDLGNLLGSVDIPIVIVTNELAIRRFTPKAEQLFNLIASDIGRPIQQINPNFICDELESLIREAIDKVAPVEREIQDRTGCWYSLRIRPYKGVDNRLDGAVLGLIDINAAKRYAAHVEHVRDYFKAIVETIRQPLIVLESDLRVRYANKSFYTTFRVLPQETERRPIQDIGNGQFNLPELRTMVERVLDGTAETDIRVERSFPQIGTRRVLVNGRPLQLDEAGPLILVAIEDITNAGN